MLKSSGGIIEEDWNNLFTKKQNAIYTIATWSFEQKNAPPVNAFFGTLFNYYDEGMKYGYQLAVRADGYLYLREWHDDTIFGEWHEMITTKNVATPSFAGLVKPGAGLQVSEDGTLSVTGGDTGFAVAIVYGLRWNPSSPDKLEILAYSLREKGIKSFDMTTTNFPSVKLHITNYTNVGAQDALVQGYFQGYGGDVKLPSIYVKGIPDNTFNSLLTCIKNTYETTWDFAATGFIGDQY